MRFAGQSNTPQRRQARVDRLADLSIPGNPNRSGETRGGCNSGNDTMTPPVAAVELPANGPQRFPSQRPYRYGMVMLCLGALINWLGLAENYFEPVRYIGVACIVTGAMLIIAAMCCWMNTNTPIPPQGDGSSVHVIDVPEVNTSASKPPDYETVAAAPPSYDVAIKLNPAEYLTANNCLQTQDEPTIVSILERPVTPPPSYSATSHLAPVHK